MPRKEDPCANGSSEIREHSLFEEIEVLEVNKENINTIWPILLLSIKSADLIALDLELSGLGTLTAGSKNLDERYSRMCETARTRGILSVGIACFKLDSRNVDGKYMKYKVQVFNVLTLCAQPFTIEPEALKFLARNAFDFNKLISVGIPYSTSDVKKESSMRTLFSEILSCGVPICLHNGLFDMMFLYHHFYSPLPNSVGEFCNSLNDLFPIECPLCDSKYLAEFVTRMKSSFLEYVFRFCQRENVQDYRNNRWAIVVEFQSFHESVSKFREATSCALPKNFPEHLVPYDIKDNLCTQFAAHGHCHSEKGRNCEKIHDVDYALDMDSERREKEREKRKRKLDYLKADSMVQKERKEYEEKRLMKQKTKIALSEMKDKKKITVEGCHRAGVDAFMTGFAVLFQCRMDLARNEKFSEQVVNKIPLSGKEEPLHILRSLYAGVCAKHEERFTRISSLRQSKVKF